MVLMPIFAVDRYFKGVAELHKFLFLITTPALYTSESSFIAAFPIAPTSSLNYIFKKQETVST